MQIFGGFTKPANGRWHRFVSSNRNVLCRVFSSPGECSSAHREGSWKVHWVREPRELMLRGTFGEIGKDFRDGHVVMDAFQQVSHMESMCSRHFTQGYDRYHEVTDLL